MKQIKILTVAICVFACCSNHSVFSQGNKPEVKEKIEKQERKMEKEVKEEKRENKDELKTIKEAHKQEIKEIKEVHKDEMESMKDHSDDDGYMSKDHLKKEKAANKSNNGNAYGKNKMGLEGREFGQARAAEARQRINNLEMEMKESESRISTIRRRLEEVRSRTQKAKEANEITEEEYVIRRQKIENAETKLTKLQQILQRNNKVVEDEKKELSSLFEKK